MKLTVGSWLLGHWSAGQALKGLAKPISYYVGKTYSLSFWQRLKLRGAKLSSEIIQVIVMFIGLSSCLLAEFAADSSASETYLLQISEYDKVARRKGFQSS